MTEFRLRPLSELFDIDKSQTSKSDSGYSALPFIGLENIESHTKRYLPEFVSEPEGMCNLFTTAHVLYGKLRPYLNKVFLPDFDGKCSTEIVPLKPKNGYSRDFISTILQSQIFIEEAVKHSTGGRMPRANLKHLLKMKVSVPDADEANAIALNLQSQLAQVEAMRQAALKQKEAAKALQSAILREVFPWQAGESLPSGWRWEKITDISKNLDGKRIPVTEKLRQKGDIPYYGASGIVDYVKDYLFDEDLLLVSEDGANLVMRTYPIAFSISGKTWVNNHAHVLKFENRDIQKITEHYINGLDISDFVSGAAQPKLNQDNLNRIRIPVPVEPQTRSGIVERIKNEFEAGRRIEKQVEVQFATIEALPAAILREAFYFEKTEK
jgi:type I restriction enzyme S subunit